MGIQKSEIHRHNVNEKKLQNVAQKLSVTGEKLAWFRDYLPAVSEDSQHISPDTVIELVEGYLSRFDDELEQIKLKNSIGGKKKKNQHSSRQDSIEFTKKRELEEFIGCGLEMPDWFDAENLKYFLEWNGELRFVQNIKLRRFNKSQLLQLRDEPTPTDPSQSATEMEVI